MTNYPDFICLECGTAYGRRPSGLATWHRDICDICGKYAPLTEPRDFGHLKPNWKTHGDPQ